MKERIKSMIAVDCVIFGYTDEVLKMALIKRKNEPYQGDWALPGGFIEENESCEMAAVRELKEETGLDQIYLEQSGVFSDPKRDPRGRVISISYVTLINADHIKLIATQDAMEAKFWMLHEHPKLAFDHQQIVDVALKKLKQSIVLKPIVFELLPKKFTLTELQKLYETLFEVEIDKRNFRKKVAKLPFIESTGFVTEGFKHRPAQLYTFNSKLYLKKFKDAPIDLI